MAREHPFHTLFETFGRLPAAHAESVNREAFETLSDILAVPVDHEGRCILLLAPRAGHGKTHLLSRVRHKLGAGHEFIPLQAASGSRVDATSVTDDTIRCLARSLPGAGGLCVLDLITRRLFALALQPLVQSGEVPCQDREGALAALRNRPIETFDFHHPNAVTAQWARENFEALCPRLAEELGAHASVPPREIAFWLDAFFRFASTPADTAGRVTALTDRVFDTRAGEGLAMERVAALLGLLSLLDRVVLVADDLEGFSADETAALKLAAFVGSLRHLVGRVDVILSLNEDVWENAFLPRLSGGLIDRLSEVVVGLEPLTEEGMVAVIESRTPGLGREVLQHVRPGPGERYARGLLKAAAAAWLRAARGERRDEEEPTPAPVEEAPQAEVEPFSFAAEGPSEPAPFSEDPPFQVDPTAPASDGGFLEPDKAAGDETRAETDQVDDLLRQFRERYGRGGL